MHCGLSVTAAAAFGQCAFVFGGKEARRLSALRENPSVSGPMPPKKKDRPPAEAPKPQQQQRPEPPQQHAYADHELFLQAFESEFSISSVAVEQSRRRVRLEAFFLQQCPVL